MVLELRLRGDTPLCSLPASQFWRIQPICINYCARRIAAIVGHWLAPPPLALLDTRLQVIGLGFLAKDWSWHVFCDRSACDAGGSG